MPKIIKMPNKDDDKKVQRNSGHSTSWVKSEKYRDENFYTHPGVTMGKAGGTAPGKDITD